MSTFHDAYRDIILPLFVATGVLGNATVVWIYIRTRDRTSTASRLIITLASTELVYLLAALAVFTLPNRCYVFGFIMPLTFGILHTARTMSVYTSVVLMLDRFSAVRFPIWRKEKFSIPAVTRLICVVFVVSAAYNSTRYFELEPAVYEFDNVTNETHMYAEVSDLRLNYYYTSIYLSWMYSIFIYVLPFVGIAILGIATAHYLRVRIATRASTRTIGRKIKRQGSSSLSDEHGRSWRRVLGSIRGKSRRGKSTVDTETSPTCITVTSDNSLHVPVAVQQREAQQRLKRQQRRDTSVTSMLVIEALCFLLCNTMPLALNLLELFDTQYFESDLFYETLVPLSNTTALVNATFRLELYLIFGTRFRMQLRETLLGAKLAYMGSVMGDTTCNQSVFLSSKPSLARQLSRRVPTSFRAKDRAVVTVMVEPTPA